MTAVAEPTIGQLERRGRAEVSKTDIIRLLETLRTTSLNSAHAGAISACRAPSAAPRSDYQFGMERILERGASPNVSVHIMSVFVTHPLFGSIAAMQLAWVISGLADPGVQ